MLDKINSGLAAGYNMPSTAYGMKYDVITQDENSTEEALDGTISQADIGRVTDIDTAGKIDGTDMLFDASSVEAFSWYGMPSALPSFDDMI